MTQAVGEAMADVVKSSGLPEGLFHLVAMPGAVAGRAMIAAGVDKLCFTGSTEAGRDVMRTAAEGPVPVSLELGGSDAMIVLDDANLDRAVGGALWAGASNAGQSCAAVERIFVEEKVYAAFREKLARRVAGLRVGPDRDFDVDVGSLSSPAQKRKVDGIVKNALAHGARLVASSGPSHGLFHPVQVLESGDAPIAALHEEIFGPVIVLAKVRDEAEAVARANDSPYGLSASVWTRSTRRGRRVASQLAVGSVTLNDHLMSHGMAETPWGGCKGSGFSRTHGEAGLAEMSRIRVTVRRPHAPGAAGHVVVPARPVGLRGAAGRPDRALRQGSRAAPLSPRPLRAALPEELRTGLSREHVSRLHVFPRGASDPSVVTRSRWRSASARTPRPLDILGIWPAPVHSPEQLQEAVVVEPRAVELADDHAAPRPQLVPEGCMRVIDPMVHGILPGDPARGKDEHPFPCELCQPVNGVEQRPVVLLVENPRSEADQVIPPELLGLHLGW